MVYGRSCFLFGLCMSSCVVIYFCSSMCGNSWADFFYIILEDAAESRFLMLWYDSYWISVMRDAQVVNQSILGIHVYLRRGLSSISLCHNNILCLWCVRFCTTRHASCGTGNIRPLLLILRTWCMCLYTNLPGGICWVGQECTSFVPSRVYVSVMREVHVGRESGERAYIDSGWP